MSVTANPSRFAGGGEMGERIRAFEWNHSPLGPMEQWPAALVSTLLICLSARFPMAIYWGNDGWLLYNDAWRPILGDKHPWALGRSAREVWPEISDTIDPLFESVRTTGEATWRGDELLPMQRFGYTEECYFDYSFNPIWGQGGQVEGILNIVQETTPRVLNDRRTRLLRELATHSGSATSEQDACTMAIAALATDPADVPFALLYAIDSDHRHAHLIASTGLADESPARPSLVSLTAKVQDGGWPFAAPAQDGRVITVDDLAERFGPLAGGAWPEPTRQALLLPISAAGPDHSSSAMLVAGISPRRPLDDDYRHFFHMVQSHIASAITNAKAYSSEKQRAEALAELDRAKTEFFNNVSHEFRTPLTLMLGPIEDELRERPDRPRLEIAHRNSLRLLKLVNTLLDFSLVEAGRTDARYEPIDLAAYTAGLAGAFDSAAEKAGLQLLVSCPPLPEPVYVDRDMWEKIVLNLLSNALKFTFEGEIALSVRQSDGRAELRIRDTGVGIPPEAAARLFERFYRVAHMRSRTHEGSGIGLALVHELVTLHGGSIHVESRVGEGSTFIVSLPLGKRHLPPDKIGAGRNQATPAVAAEPYVEEALRWLPSEANDELGMLNDELSEASLRSPQGEHSAFNIQHSASPLHARPCVLVADDNRDMRRYIARLLAERYRVIAVQDGEAALTQARAHLPDLILSDVMMPGLDGFGLLRELRADPMTKCIPVILLSARAGEESRLQGLEQGADDYLIKPFSARELLARVGTHLDMARVRREAEAEIGRSKHFLERIAASTPDILFVYDIVEGRNIYINRSLESVLGYSPEQFQSMPRELTDVVIHPADAAGIRDWYARFHSVADEEILEHEHRARHMDGSYRWILARATVFERTADGRAKQIIGVARDMTERKQVEHKLADSEARFRAIVIQATAGVAQTDLSGRFLLVNRRFCEMVGYSEAELLGMSMQHITHPDDLPRNLAHFDRLVNGGPDFALEKRYLRKDGSEVWASVSVGAVRADGELQHILAVALDITDRKRQETEVIAQNRRQHALYGLADAVNRAAAVTDIYENALGAIISSLRADRASILLFDDEGVMRFKAWRGLSDHYRRAVEGHSPWQPDTRNPRAIVLGNIAEAGMDNELAATIQREGIQALGFIPLTYGGCLLGKFMVYYDHPHVMDDEEIGLAQAIAGTLALGIERKRAEEALRQRTAQFETLLKVAPLGVYLVDDDFRIREMNPTARLAFGDITDLIGRDFDEVMRILRPAAYAEEIIARFRHTLETGEPVIIPEWIQQRRDRGRREYYEWQIHRIPLPEGSQGVVCYFRNISAQVQARQAIADREGRMRLAMSSGEMGAWDMDLHTGEVTWDAKQYELFGQPQNESPRDMDQFYELVHAEDLGRVKAAADEAETTGRFFQEFRIVLPDGRIRWMAGHGATMADEQGLPLRLVGVNYDITERKQSEEQLQEFAAQLEHRVSERTLELTQSREQLRSLTTELNLAGQRERQRLAMELHDYLAQLLALSRIRLAQAKQQPMTPVLSKTLNDVQEIMDQALTYTRTLVAQLSPPVLKDFGLPMALKWLAEQMQQRDLDVSLELEKDFLALPEDHAMLLFQSVRELLLNIVKHADTKQARIRMRDIDGWLHISVADQGMGFEISGASSTAESGSPAGFGLFSIRERMLALGGRFELSSRTGMGTEATLITPLAPKTASGGNAESRMLNDELPAASPISGQQQAPTIKGASNAEGEHSALITKNSAFPPQGLVRVLIADDHAMVRQGLSGLLAGYADIEVIGEAANGEAAIDLALQLQPDIILMDVNMPKMDGIEATRRIKQGQPHITIIGLSVDNSRHIEQAMREAGAAAFHTKEAAVDQLYRTIQALPKRAHGAPY